MPRTLGVSIFALLVLGVIGCAAGKPSQTGVLPKIDPIPVASLPVPEAVSDTGPAYATVQSKTQGMRCNAGRCGELVIDTVLFKDHSAFNEFVSLALASMAWTREDQIAPFRGLDQLHAYFVDHAHPDEQLTLSARILRLDADLVVLALSRYLFAGGAHGTTAVQYVNWLVSENQVVSLQTMLLPGQMPGFTEALRIAHEQWLVSQKDAIGTDVTAFRAAWPFKPTDNAALMPQGLQVTYERYVIAPGSFGEPSLFVPYATLQSILKPKVLGLAR
jgi:hypothetical protein